MEYAAESGKQEIAEELLSWFLERKAYDCFSACLYQVSKRANRFLLLLKKKTHNKMATNSFPPNHKLFHSAMTYYGQMSFLSSLGDTKSQTLQCRT